jgi:hypothetical protein
MITLVTKYFIAETVQRLGRIMGVRVIIKNAETGANVAMDLEPTNSVQEIIDSIAMYWEKDAGAYVIRKGKRLLKGEQMIGDLGFVENDEIELIPDPEGGI